MKVTTLTRLRRLPSIAFAVTASAVLAVTVAEARITRIDITTAESPTFGGTTFGTVGAYEKLRGKAYGEVDPADPRNALITDIELAPRSFSYAPTVPNVVPPKVGDSALVISILVMRASATVAASTALAVTANAILARCRSRVSVVTFINVPPSC